MSKKLYGLSLLLISTMAYGDFCPCPSNFNLIQIGNSLDQVLKTCCAPISRKTHKAEAPVPQKWSYTITPPPNPGGAVQGSTDLIVTFDQTEKVANIKVNAQSLTATSCGKTSTVSFDVNQPNMIQIGDTMQTVQTTCGKPLFIEKGVPQTDNQPTSTITELQYAGPPPVTLYFENNVLTKIEK